MIMNRTRRRVVASVAAAVVTAAVLSLAIAASQASSGGPHNAKQALLQRQLRAFGGAKRAWARAHPALARQRLEQAIQKLHAEARTFREHYRPPGDRIVDTKDSPFPAYQFVAQNAYDGTLHGRGIRVVAGCAETGTPVVYRCARGAVGIWADKASAPGGIVEVGIFRAPTKSPLVIIAFHGSELRLRSLAGQTFTFNLETHQFS